MGAFRAVTLRLQQAGEMSQPPGGALARVHEAAGVVARRHFDRARCARWVEGTLAARPAWTPAFGAEQFSLGRAFYTDLEQDSTRAYFADATASDARVEAAVPGLQDAMCALVATLTGGHVVGRRGFCGPGIHVFPSGGEVARRGGVIHFDNEGLGRHQLARRTPALSVVAMLQPAERGGGLRLWDARYRASDAPSEADLAAPRVTVRYGVGDVVAFDSYRLHQIRPFSGTRDRISATVHAAEVSPGLWETWF